MLPFPVSSEKGPLFFQGLLSEFSTFADQERAGAHVDFAACLCTGASLSVLIDTPSSSSQGIHNIMAHATEPLPPPRQLHIPFHNTDRWTQNPSVVNVSAVPLLSRMRPEIWLLATGRSSTQNHRQSGLFKCLSHREVLSQPVNPADFHTRYLPIKTPLVHRDFINCKLSNDVSEML